MSTDKTPFKRDILRSQKFTTTSEVDKASVVSGTPPLNSKLPVLGLTDKRNPEPSVVIANSNALHNAVYLDATIARIPGRKFGLRPAANVKMWPMF